MTGYEFEKRRIIKAHTINGVLTLKGLSELKKLAVKYNLPKGNWIPEDYENSDWEKRD